MIWNARCPSRITGRDMADECRHLAIDLPTEPRARWLHWAGHVLRLDKTHLTERMLLTRAEKISGGSYRDVLALICTFYMTVRFQTVTDQ